jgi:two-component system CheB/CheR fusion protein
MVLHKLDRLTDYAGLLARNPQEVDALFQDILIGVTSFFRNSEAFDGAANEGLPRAGAWPLALPGDPHWVVGCSDRRERPTRSPSSGMEFRREPGDRSAGADLRHRPEPGPARAARAAGFYTSNILQDVSPERIRRYFVEADGGYRIHKPHPRHVRVRTPQRTRGSAVLEHGSASCRNLLIYLEPELQRRVEPMLHYRDQAQGFLMLGSSETVGTLPASLFEVHQRQAQDLHTQARRRRGPILAFPHPIRRMPRTCETEREAAVRAARRPRSSSSRSARPIACCSRATPRRGVLVNDDFDHPPVPAEKPART